MKMLVTAFLACLLVSSVVAGGYGGYGGYGGGHGGYGGYVKTVHGPSFLVKTVHHVNKLHGGGLHSHHLVGVGGHGGGYGGGYGGYHG